MAPKSFMVFWLVLVSFPRMVSAATSFTTISTTASEPSSTARTTTSTADVTSSTTTPPETTLPDTASPDMTSPDMTSPDVASSTTTPQATTLPDTASPDMTSPDMTSTGSVTVVTDVSTTPTDEPTTTAQSATEAVETKSNTGIIAGAVSGSIVLLAVVAAIVTVLICKRSREQIRHVASPVSPDGYYLNDLESAETKQAEVRGISQPTPVCTAEIANNDEQNFAKITRHPHQGSLGNKPVEPKSMHVPGDKDMYSQIDEEHAHLDSKRQFSNQANAYEALLPRDQQDEEQTYEQPFTDEGKVQYANQEAVAQNANESKVEYANQEAAVQNTEDASNYTALQLPMKDDHIYDTHE